MAVDMVEALAEIARHFDVLDLVAAHRHLVGLEDQDVGGHQHRVHEQAGVDARVIVLLLGAVLVYCGLVGVGTVEDALARHAGQEPGQLRDFGNVGLAVEPHLVRVQPGSQPGRGDFQGGALGTRRILRLDQAVQVGQEIETFRIAGLAGRDGGTHRTHVVPQVRGAGGGDAGKDSGHARGTA